MNGFEVLTDPERTTLCEIAGAWNQLFTTVREVVALTETVLLERLRLSSQRGHHIVGRQEIQFAATSDTILYVTVTEYALAFITADESILTGHYSLGECNC